MDCIRRGTWNVPEVKNSPICVSKNVGFNGGRGGVTTKP